MGVAHGACQRQTDYAPMPDFPPGRVPSLVGYITTELHKNYHT